jgi:hypothetical protein
MTDWLTDWLTDFLMLGLFNGAFSSVKFYSIERYDEENDELKEASAAHFRVPPSICMKRPRKNTKRMNQGSRPQDKSKVVPVLN